MLGTDVQKNEIKLAGDAKKYMIPVASPQALGAALAEIASREPASIVGKIFYTYDYAPTGSDLIDIFTQLHGKAPAVVEYTDEDFKRDIKGHPGQAITALAMKTWGKGIWGPNGQKEYAGERVGPPVRDIKSAVEKYFKA